MTDRVRDLTSVPNATYHLELALVDGAVVSDVLVSVAGGRFESIEPDTEAPEGARRLHGLTIPGLANAHSHAFQRALRARTQAERGTFWTWRDLMYRAADRLDPDACHRLARATFGEMVLAGITTVGEFHYVHHQPDGTPYVRPNEMGDAVLAAAADAGLRITLLDTLYLHGGLSADGYQSPTGAQLRYSDGSAEAWVTRVNALEPAAGQRVGAAIHSIRAVDPDSIKLAASWAAEAGAPIHAHVSEQHAENEQCLARHGTTPLGLLADLDVLDARFTAVHATHLVPEDVARLAESSSAVCICPTTERDLGDGIGPTAELVDAGVALCLGSDSHAVIDLFEEARAVELDERLRSQRRGTHAASELLAMATSAGHASLGWPDAGHIRPGDRADMVTVDLTSVRTAGAGAAHATEAAVFAATAGDVTSVIVDGRVVVDDGHHLGIDVGRELHAAIASVMDAP